MAMRDWQYSCGVEARMVSLASVIPLIKTNQPMSMLSEESASGRLRAVLGTLSF
jgi:hypothetical protein